MPVRPFPFDSNITTQKRRKTSQGTEAAPVIFTEDEASSEEDSGADDSEVATLPLNHVVDSSNLLSQAEFGSAIFSSSPPATYQSTVPTQIIDLPPSKPTIQVQASSPVREKSSPVKSIQSVRNNGDGAIKPFSFYSSRTQGPILASDDGPHYIGSSSDAESDHNIVPDFETKPISKPNVPSVRDIMSRREMGASTAATERVEESPVGKPNFSRFAYKPSEKPPQFGRLDSIKNPVVGSLADSYARARGVQQFPAKAKPVVDIRMEDIRDLEIRRKVARMATIVPDKPITALVAALEQKRGNFDDAIDLVTTDDGVIDLTSYQRPLATAEDKTSKRQARAPRQAIKDKWSATQAQTRLPSLSPEVAAKPKRRLIRGSKTASIVSSSLPASPEAITIDSDEDSEHDSDDVDEEYEQELETKVLNFINTGELKDLMDISTSSEEICQAVIKHRMYRDLEQVRAVSLGEPAQKAKGKRGNPKRAVGNKLVDICIETFRGYEAVDVLIKKCSELGKPLAESIRGWGVDTLGKNGTGELEIVNVNMDSGLETPNTDDAHDMEDTVRGRGRGGNNTTKFMRNQPKNLAPDVTLKDYQIVGVNWLNMLYERKLSCILADEMGLGKTCQVVSFLAHLLTTGEKGPHLVVVPASTLENWLREFKRFCPDLVVEPYYGTQKQRTEARYALYSNTGFNVIVTTYNIATGDKMDRKFLRGQNFNVCVYDEGHMLKNSSSSRYTALMQLPAKFRLLLTGTPLQNNLQELASLLAFILPQIFVDKKEDLANIFKYKAKTTDESDSSNSALLSATRIKRARAMMTPFVLRRKKAQVLGKHLPEKTTRVEYCEMHDAQKAIYNEEIQAAQTILEERAAGKKASKSTNNTMMQLRKAAIHPFLFRKYFTDEIIKKMSKAILKEEAYRGKDPIYIEEDMAVMNDFELSRLCLCFPSTLGKYAFRNDEWMSAGKVETLSRLLVDMKAAGDRILVFSQFTQVLDILERVMSTLDMTFLRLDGSTKVEDRQNMIDQFYDEDDITVFLLSTKAGGFGINLACANKVVIFDSSFNPHDDRQAADRAHRVGQTRPVEVINLVTKGTIEEAILALANTKLALDQSVSEDSGTGPSAVEVKAEEMVARMMLGGKI